MIRLSEITSNAGHVAKEYSISKDGKVKVTSAATIYDAVARPIEVERTNFAEYLDSLCSEDKKCITLGICGDTGDEYKLVTESNLKANTIARTQEFFSYANSGATCVCLLDFDSDASDEVRMNFLKELDCILSPALIGAGGYERTTIQKWFRPSSSASASIGGKIGNGLHVFIPVKGLTKELVELIHKFCWMTPYGKGHRVTKAATILSESLIDEKVHTAERLIYTSDAIASGDGIEDFYEHVHRPCSTINGGILDCESACIILRELTAGYDFEWNTYKNLVENTKEVKDLRYKWVKAQTEKRMKAGLRRPEAKKASECMMEGKLLASEELRLTDGKVHTVAEILSDFDAWKDVGHFRSPADPDTKRNVGMVMGDVEEPIFHCFAHGGIKYKLIWDYASLNAWVEAATDGELDDWYVTHFGNSEMSETDMSKLTKIVNKRLGYGIRDIKKDVKVAKEAVATTPRNTDENQHLVLDKDAGQMEIILAYKAVLDEHKGYGNGLYVWSEGSSIWSKQSQAYVAHKVALPYGNCKQCKNTTQYGKIASGIVNYYDDKVTKWDQAYGIPCSDGFYEVGEHIEGGVQRVDYSKELGCRFKIGIKPDPTMKTPYWDKVIANVDNEVLFQQLCGLTISGYMNHMQKIFTMFGKGGSGKGSTNDVLTALVDKSRVSSVPLDELNNPKFLPELTDSVINVISEVSEAKKIDMTGIKKASGGDQMTAWNLYIGAEGFTPTCCFVLNFNMWPQIRFGDDIKRRFGHSIIEFTKSHDKQIDGLADKIIDHELPGVLAWCIRGVELYFGCEDFPKGGLMDSTSLALYSRWNRASDPFALFFEEGYIFDKGNQSVSRPEFWKEYLEYCADAQSKPEQKSVIFGKLENMPNVSFKGFAKEFRIKGIKSKRA